MTLSVLDSDRLTPVNGRRYPRVMIAARALSGLYYRPHL